ncbi:MAG TPA: hypothetical protein VFM98_11800 [Ramlibacter sp.]|uniref:hypothetical protein n=1 Tax=Ramlibacter sp. TaxID=1917967 RepID=UPI002D7F56C5|nr:hypothetical protein [Ramlibacter sp.]HET8746281.1 hypothetical protein [Ramlibacter sp.]
MAQDDTDKDRKAPNATSPGNAGARGSRGQANSGAQPANSTNAGADERAPERGTDPRDADAQGGGGVASESSRSK